MFKLHDIAHTTIRYSIAYNYTWFLILHVNLSTIYINIHHKKDNTTQNNTTLITVMIPNLLKYALAAMHKSRNKSHHITINHIISTYQKTAIHTYYLQYMSLHVIYSYTLINRVTTYYMRLILSIACAMRAATASHHIAATFPAMT